MPKQEADRFASSARGFLAALPGWAGLTEVLVLLFESPVDARFEAEHTAETGDSTGGVGPSWGDAMRRIVALVSALLGTVALVLTGGPTGGLARADAATVVVHTIVYAEQRGNVWNLPGGIWQVNPDGSGRHEISAVDTNSVALAPDGHRLAYVAAGEIWLTSTAGSTPRQLTHTGGNVGSIDWSPNGTWIAYSAAVGTGSDLYKIRPSGGAPTRMTRGALHDCDAVSPTWAPDSSTIAYERFSRSARCASPGLVVQQPGHSGHVIVAGDIRDPSYTPAGLLVYTAICTDPDVCGGLPVGWVVHADGSRPTMVANYVTCTAGDDCLEAMIGAAAGVGWLEWSAYAANEDPTLTPSTCIKGRYQKAGAVMGSPINLCLDDVLMTSVTVA